jgi:hypothetical protein
VWPQLWQRYFALLDERERAEWGRLFIDSIFAAARAPGRARSRANADGRRRGWWHGTAKACLLELTGARAHAPIETGGFGSHGSGGSERRKSGSR